MILIIDTTSGDYLQVILAKSEDDFKLKKVVGRFKQSEKLLATIEKILKENKIKLGQIKKIGVVSGPGGFTSLRIGVVTANTLSYALGVPVVGINRDELDGEGEMIKKIIKLKNSKVVLPEYGKEPNITVSKNLKK